MPTCNHSHWPNDRLANWHNSWRVTSFNSATTSTH